MGVNWAACLIRWQPHVRRNGEELSLSHLHPFRFEVRFAADRGRPARLVEIQVGFACHVFTCDTTAELIVQSAYVGKQELRPRGQSKQPIGFRAIVRNVILQRALVEAR
jgi:hypothetical protein